MHNKQSCADCTGFPYVRGKLVQAATLGTSWPIALQHKVDTTSTRLSCLQQTFTNRRHHFLCLMRAAHLPGPGCVFSHTLLSLHRLASSATVAFRSGDSAYKRCVGLFATFGRSDQLMSATLCSASLTVLSQPADMRLNQALYLSSNILNCSQ